MSTRTNVHKDDGDLSRMPIDFKDLGDRSSAGCADRWAHYGPRNSQATNTTNAACTGSREDVTRSLSHSQSARASLLRLNQLKSDRSQLARVQLEEGQHCVSWPSAIRLRSFRLPDGQPVSNIESSLPAPKIALVSINGRQSSYLIKV